MCGNLSTSSKRTPVGFFVVMRSPMHLHLSRIMESDASCRVTVCPGGLMGAQAAQDIILSLGDGGWASWTCQVEEIPTTKRTGGSVCQQSKGNGKLCSFSLKLWENQAFNTTLPTSNQSNIGSSGLFYFEALAYLHGIKTFPNWL